jgi:hypothetical protein
MYQEGTTGTLTSVNSPGTATKITTEGYRTGLVAIRNLGANTISITVTGYANRTPLTAGIEDKALTDIASNATVTYSFSNVTRAYITVTVVPKVAGSQSEYVIEHCLGL